MLRKKVGRVARSPRLSSTPSSGSITDAAVSRRDFLKRSGLTVGGLAAGRALTAGTATEADATGDPTRGLLDDHDPITSARFGGTF